MGGSVQGCTQWGQNKQEVSTGSRPHPLCVHMCGVGVPSHTCINAILFTVTAVY